MLEDMAVRGFASNTQVAYLRAVAQLAQFYGRSPDRLSEREIQRYLVHLDQETVVVQSITRYPCIGPGIVTSWASAHTPVELRHVIRRA